VDENYLFAEADDDDNNAHVTRYASTSRVWSEGDQGCKRSARGFGAPEHADRSPLDGDEHATFLLRKAT
jgi:hypothetical protein